MLLQPASSQMGLARGTVVMMENSITVWITEQEANDGVLSPSVSQITGACHRSAPGSPHCSPTPLVRVVNRLARLIPLTKRPRDHNLKAKTSCHNYTEDVSFSHQPTILSIHAVDGPDVRGEPYTQKKLFPEDSVRLSFVTSDLLYVV
ncbi:hypothetical protein TNCV_3744021 [Trichonephila clavipes]|nr:hypothetical protein TNCV_3744021 [Trichonephila clavipes]